MFLPLFAGMFFEKLPLFAGIFLEKLPLFAGINLIFHLRTVPQLKKYVIKDNRFIIHSSKTKLYCIYL